MNIHPIKGSQLPQQNNAQAECICVKKLYDWVIVPVEEHICTDVPSNCLPQVLEVRNLGIACCLLESTSPHQFKVFSIRRNIPGFPASAALVSICCTLLVRLSLFDEDNPECPICCIEAPVTFLVKRVVLCLPEELEEQITCEPLCCEAHGVICNGKLEFSLFISIGIRVEASVILEVVGKFCSPRLPIEAPTQRCFFEGTCR